MGEADSESPFHRLRKWNEVEKTFLMPDWAFLPLLVAHCHSSLQMNNHMLRDGGKWEGCNKWRDVGKVEVPIIDWDWSLQEAWLEHASELGLLYIFIEVMKRPQRHCCRAAAFPALLHMSCLSITCHNNLENSQKVRQFQQYWNCLWCSQRSQFFPTTLR